MAFDGIAISCIVKELESNLLNGRIDKITQPERDEIHINIRADGKNHKLIASASYSNPRIHISREQKNNPEKAPMFCMLLRKHLLGGKITGFSQPEFERVIKMHIESYDELGDLSIKTLIVEIMGRHSNIILTDSNEVILGSIKHVDFTVSSLRQIISGMRYELPPSQNKINPTTIPTENIYAIVSVSKYPADKFILETFTGVGPLNAREIAYRALGDFERPIPSLSKDEQKSLAEEIAKCFKEIECGKYTPILIYKENNNIFDFNAIDITQYEDKFKVEKRNSLWEALDEFYSIRDWEYRMVQKTASLLKFIDNNIQRCQKKLALQQQKLKESRNRDKYKMYGDLLISNIHLIKEKTSEIQLENFFDNMQPIKIQLLPELSPSQNVQRYYNLYQKAKNAEKMTGRQIKLTTSELEYLESVKESLQRAENEQDIEEIKKELILAGYNFGKTKLAPVKGKKEPATMPHIFTIDGFEVFVGKNNIQNDRLTLKEAKKSDLWFHVKDYPGSHTIVKTQGKTPTDDSIVKFAKIAAYFSKAKNSANVPVDYTIVKNVKKPSGAKPGMVIYENYKTINVKPEITS
jgi:predicted ribosome quality control (RQC) complex YloA/Tae2 family protein